MARVESGYPGDLSFDEPVTGVNPFKGERSADFWTLGEACVAAGGYAVLCERHFIGIGNPTLNQSPG
jgi:hypothetical protein